MPSILLDTSVAIPLRDGDEDVWARANALTSAPYVSILTMVELEGGVYRDPALTSVRRAGLAALDGKLDVLFLGDAELLAYRAILEACGYSRPRIIDRLIAATAIANGLSLATRNPKDFSGIPELNVEEW